MDHGVVQRDPAARLASFPVGPVLMPRRRVEHLLVLQPACTRGLDLGLPTTSATTFESAVRASARKTGQVVAHPHDSLHRPRPAARSRIYPVRGSGLTIDVDSVLPLGHHLPREELPLHDEAVPLKIVKNLDMA